MKFSKLLLTAGICLCTLYTQAQNDNGWKYGNYQLKLTVKSLETYFVKPYTITQFEKTLGQYLPKDYISDTTAYADGTVKINMPYINMSSKQLKDGVFDELFTSYDGNQKLTSLRFILEEHDVNVDRLQAFMRQINAAGYKYDLRSTRLQGAFAGNSRKFYYWNAAKKVHISIYFIEENRYAVEFSK
jgi:hypothetical protein